MKKTLMTLLLAALTMSGSAQTENPRGIYRLVSLDGKVGEVNAPFEQYKICTDSVTMMLSVQNAYFQFTDSDHKVFNYTGNQPKDENDKTTLIYDSNADHFTMKWWSNLEGHLYFPENGWCEEKYVAGNLSETAKLVYDAVNGRVEDMTKNPIVGAWRLIGYMDELRDIKKEVGRLQQQYPTSRFFDTFFIFTPSHWVGVANNGVGKVSQIQYDGKNACKIDNESVRVKWISKDCIAVEERIDYRIDWQVLERITDGVSPFSRMAGKYAKALK